MKGHAAIFFRDTARCLMCQVLFADEKCRIRTRSDVVQSKDGITSCKTSYCVLKRPICAKAICIYACCKSQNIGVRIFDI
jgi:hypothetical protein